MEAVDRQTIIDEDKDAIGSFISIFANVLLAFAGIALFVSAFIINNTFAIILGQRVRELALLRAIGASVNRYAGCWSAKRSSSGCWPRSSG